MGVIDEIAAERRRQIEVELRSPDWDDQYVDGQLSRAAACYAAHASAWNRIPVSREAYRMSDARRDRVGWPWALSWWKPKSARRDLIRAAALIVAEIERLDRSNERAGRQCPVCLDALLDEDDCATDIDMGTCHAGCLEGAPVVNLETGEEVRDAVPATFKFATPLPAALAS